MNYNNKRLERFSKFINAAIAIALCGFLIAFSSLLIDDADQWKYFPQKSDFENDKLINQEQLKIHDLDDIKDSLNTISSTLDNKINKAKNDHLNAKKSFDNWLDTRKTTGSNLYDQAVLNRANELDDLFEIEQNLLTKKEEVKKEIDELNVKIEQHNALISKEKSNAIILWEEAVSTHRMNTFLVRLSIIIPIFLIAIFFALKKRKHKFWPLFLGYILFALYAFFFGLVPYLPSYGGYIRYAVGILLCIGSGIYIINKIRAFIEHKRTELSASQSERATKVHLEIAEKAFDNHMCPSCGKDFVIKNWKKLPNQSNKIQLIHSKTKFCRFCGLVLFKDCGNCGTENFAHLPYCSNCGTQNEEEEKTT